MGYKEIKVAHMTDKHQMIPPIKIKSNNSRNNNTNTDSISTTNDTILLPKNTRLQIFKLSPSKKSAVSLVCAFEEYYQYKSNNSDTKYQKASLCLKWTKSLRESNTLQYSGNPFLNWCKMYYTVKILMKGTPPKGILRKIGCESRARAYFRIPFCKAPCTVYSHGLLQTRKLDHQCFLTTNKHTQSKVP